MTLSRIARFLRAADGCRPKGDTAIRGVLILTNFGSRTATWRDPNLHNAYVMNWSSGIHYQPGNTWLVNVQYQGSAGVGLQRNWNINGIPLSIALGGNRALQDTVFQSQQNYMIYPQFGTVNLSSNFNHNTWHSGNISLEKRYGKGLTFTPASTSPKP